VQRANAALIARAPELLTENESLRAKNQHLRTENALLQSDESFRAHAELTALRTQKAQLLEALEGMLAIVADSHGVAGFHRNDAAAGWDEFEGVAVARTAIAAARGEP